MESMEARRKSSAGGWAILAGGVVVIIFGLVAFFMLQKQEETQGSGTFDSVALLIVMLVIGFPLLFVGGYLVRQADTYNRELDRIGLTAKARELEIRSVPQPATAQTPASRFCPSCGAEVRQLTPFCPMCGKKL